MMTIVVNAEEKFGVRIPDDEVKNLKTVGDAVVFIAERPGLTRDAAWPGTAADRPAPHPAAAAQRQHHRPDTQSHPMIEGAPP